MAKFIQHPAEGLYMKIKVDRKMARELGNFFSKKYPESLICDFFLAYGHEQNERHMYLKINETWNEE